MKNIDRKYNFSVESRPINTIIMKTPNEFMIGETPAETGSSRIDIRNILREKATDDWANGGGASTSEVDLSSVSMPDPDDERRNSFVG